MAEMEEYSDEAPEQGQGPPLPRVVPQANQAKDTQ